MRAGQICQRDNYFPPKGNMDLASGVCFLVSVDIVWVNVSNQNSMEAEYMLIKTLVIAFDW